MAIYSRRRRAILSPFSVFHDDDSGSSSNNMSRQSSPNFSRRARSMSMSMSVSKSSAPSYKDSLIHSPRASDEIHRSELSKRILHDEINTREMSPYGASSNVSSPTKPYCTDKPLPPPPQDSVSDLHETASTSPLLQKRILKNKSLNLKLSTKTKKKWSLHGFRKSHSPDPDPDPNPNPNPKSPMDRPDPSLTALPRATSFMKLSDFYKSSSRSKDATAKISDISEEEQEPAPAVPDQDYSNHSCRVHQSKIRKTKALTCNISDNSSDHSFRNVKAAISTRLHQNALTGRRKRRRHTIILTGTAAITPRQQQKGGAVTTGKGDTASNVHVKETENLTSPKLQRMLDSPVKNWAGGEAAAPNRLPKVDDMGNLITSAKDLSGFMASQAGNDDLDPFVDSIDVRSQPNVLQDLKSFKFGSGSSAGAHRHHEQEHDGNGTDFANPHHDKSSVNLMETSGRDRQPREPDAMVLDLTAQSTYSLNISGLRQHPHVMSFAFPPTTGRSCNDNGNDEDDEDGTDLRQYDSDASTNLITLSPLPSPSSPRNRAEDNYKRQAVALSQSPLKRLEPNSSNSSGVSRWEFVPEQAVYMMNGASAGSDGGGGWHSKSCGHAPGEVASADADNFGTVDDPMEGVESTSMPPPTNFNNNNHNRRSSSRSTPTSKSHADLAVLRSSFGTAGSSNSAGAGVGGSRSKRSSQDAGLVDPSVVLKRIRTEDSTVPPSPPMFHSRHTSAESSASTSVATATATMRVNRWTLDESAYGHGVLGGGFEDGDDGGEGECDGVEEEGDREDVGDYEEEQDEGENEGDGQVDEEEDEEEEEARVGVAVMVRQPSAGNRRRFSVALDGRLLDLM